MRRNNLLAVAAASGAMVVLSACSINVQKEPNGQDKQVDIKTLVGGMHVSNQADASDIGIPIYPGARLQDKDTDGSNKSANVNLSGFGYGLRVIALEYESDDAPEKVVAFYRDQLKKYGNPIECRTSGLDIDTNMASQGSKDKSDELTCEKSSGKDVELKVGKKHDQHIVAIEPQGKGSKFSLVYVRTHGKDADI
ncbi:MAG TPA: hypothetical protein VND65_06490 [Candidatus Binatia bacterium]|nr:hypothetical protein [Candidatus Binatia bacterium]